MKTQNIQGQTFSGKMICGSGLEGTGHFLTKRVINVIHAAPKETILRVEGWKSEPLCATVRFSHSGGDLQLGVVSGLKKNMTEESVLEVIRSGIKQMRETGYFIFAEKPWRKRAQAPKQKAKSDLPF